MADGWPGAYGPATINGRVLIEPEDNHVYLRARAGPLGLGEFIFIQFNTAMPDYSKAGTYGGGTVGWHWPKGMFVYTRENRSIYFGTNNVARWEISNEGHLQGFTQNPNPVENHNRYRIGKRDVIVKEIFVGVVSAGDEDHVKVETKNAAPPDEDLANGQISFYLDEAGNALKVRVKYSDGTLKTGTVNLT